jgi:RNA methyltransferase, TrmH family
MPIITSLQNPRVKDAVRLRDRRHREKQGRILIDGARELRRAIDAGVKPVEAFVCEPLCEGSDAQHLLAVLPQCGGEVWNVTEAVFERLAFGERAEGVLGVAEMPRPTLATLSTGSRGSPITSPLVAVLEGIEKPGNVGAVLRSADAAGLSAVIVADGRTDLYNPNAIRASMGTIFTMPVCQAESRDVLTWLRERQFAIVAARVDGSTLYTKTDYRRATAIVLGSESAGLSPIWTGNDIHAIRLPMLGAADSLNVSVTAAVLFYEALRQRTCAAK